MLVLIESYVDVAFEVDDVTVDGLRKKYQFVNKWHFRVVSFPQL